MVSPTKANVNDMTNRFHTMGVQTPRVPRGSIISPDFVGSFGTVTPAIPQFVQPYPMHPMALQGATNAPAAYPSQTPARRPSAISGTPNTPMPLPMISPVFTPPATPMGYGYTGNITTPTPRSIVRYSSAPSARRQNAMPVIRNSPYHATPNANHHNQVDVERIREGIDVRTTVSTQIKEQSKIC